MPRVVRLERRGAHVNSRRFYQIGEVIRETKTALVVRILYREGDVSGATKRYRKSDGFEIPSLPGNDPRTTWHVVGEPREGQVEPVRPMERIG